MIHAWAMNMSADNTIKIILNCPEVMQDLYPPNMSHLMLFQMKKKMNTEASRVTTKTQLILTDQSK